MPKTVTIKHQLTQVDHEFVVKNPNKLTPAEVKEICEAMNVQALYVEGRYYSRNF